MKTVAVERSIVQIRLRTNLYKSKILLTTKKNSRNKYNFAHNADVRLNTIHQIELYASILRFMKSYDLWEKTKHKPLDHNNIEINSFAVFPGLHRYAAFGGGIGMPRRQRTKSRYPCRGYVERVLFFQMFEGEYTRPNTVCTNRWENVPRRLKFFRIIRFRRMAKQAWQFEQLKPAKIEFVSKITISTVVRVSLRNKNVEICMYVLQ